MKVISKIPNRNKHTKKQEKIIYLFGICKITKSAMSSQSLPLIKSKSKKIIYRKDIIYYQGLELTQNKLAEIAKQRKQIMNIIDKSDILFKGKGANDYENLWKELKTINIVKDKKDFIVEYPEAEIYTIIKSSGRSHLSSKYGLASQLEKDISFLAKKDKKYKHIYVKYTNKSKVFYISSMIISAS